jgi:hypothetical protein
MRHVVYSFILFVRHMTLVKLTNPQLFVLFSFLFKLFLLVSGQSLRFL